ncbi:MFS transporter [Streptomyces sp. NPDC005576]|uniref:MFS transporter n=1 Tax=Streptomyces sp. NPDC005576 TaxID=3364726 RepID=UPI0036BAE8F5
MPNPNKPWTVYTGSRGGSTSPPSAARLRIALTAFFALDGFLFAGWVVRIPAVKHHISASASSLGLALLGVSAGAVITMVLTGRLCHRYGSHRVGVWCGILLSLSIALPAHAGSALTLGLLLLVFGAAYGGMNVAMNSAAVDLVAALRRPVLPTFHAAFSFGGMAGAGVGGIAAGHLSPVAHLTLLAATALLVTAVAAPVMLRNTPEGAAESTAPPGGSTPSEPAAPPAHSAPSAAGSRGAVPRMSPAVRRVVLLFGVIALCTAYGEGALAEWSALHLSQDLHATPGTAAAGYSLFALAMGVGRLTGTALLERFGQTRTLVSGGGAAAAGMLLGSLAPTVPLTLAGFAVTGLGLANIFPVAVGRAGALAGPGGVAAASTLGYGGMLVGPPVIGFLADWLSLPIALTTVTLLSAAAAALGYVSRTASPRP